MYNLYLWSEKKFPAILVRKYSGSSNFVKYVDCGFPNCVYGVSLQMIKAARGMSRSMLNASASCLSLLGKACMSLILTLIHRNVKWSLHCWRGWESSGEMWHLLTQLLCSMLGTCYELLPEQHSGLDACLVYSIHHCPVLRSSGPTSITIWET